MPDPSNTNAPRSITEPRSSFIRDAMAERERRHELLARVSTLEATLAECLHHFAALHGVPTDKREPECVIRAKRLLGWTLG